MRELKEEASVKVKNIKLLGVQKIEYSNNPNREEGDEFYQVRMICELDKLLKQAPDPANGNIWQRKFVPLSKITDYIKWGKIGESMFSDAIEMYRRHLSTTILLLEGNLKVSNLVE